MPCHLNTGVVVISFLPDGVKRI
ncbi:hypothetical protein SPHINGOT1_660038 [Sphingomonas sp. T1]|nr:hypothetical protein SPHINGOT1_660038 [Sphingomonas sp. T1]